MLHINVCFYLSLQEYCLIKSEKMCSHMNSFSRCFSSSFSLSLSFFFSVHHYGSFCFFFPLPFSSHFINSNIFLLTLTKQIINSTQTEQITAKLLLEIGCDHYVYRLRFCRMKVAVGKLGAVICSFRCYGGMFVIQWLEKNVSCFSIRPIKTPELLSSCSSLTF